MELEYFGKAYHGWQRQPGALSVQQVVEESLSTLLQENTVVVGAGRTDAGVHAQQLFAHFDSEADLSQNFIFRINSLLPGDVAVKDLLEVKADAHARFDAYSRSYEYHITSRKNVFLKDAAYFVKRELDVVKMNEASKILFEYSNFKCFSRSRTDVHTYNCKITDARWIQDGSDLVFHITADRFLRNMVRAIVGTLLEIGLGKMETREMHRILKSEDRREAGASVPAHGLYLTRIMYPDSIFS